MTFRYPLSNLKFGPEEREAVIRVMDSGRLTMGERVEEFEQAFARYVGARYAVMTNSGSSANLLMMCAAKKMRQAGSEIILPGLSWSTSYWPIVQHGFKPVFADIDLDTLALDPIDVRRKITSNTTAILLLHVMGIKADVNAIVDLCDEFGLTLLEDSCESLGLRYGSAVAGTMHTVGAYSFYNSHHLSTIEGGMVVTCSSEIRDNLASMRAHGWTRGRSDKKIKETHHKWIDPRFLFCTEGYNVRPTEIAAAIGLEQLKKLPESIDKRRDIYSQVKALLRSKTQTKLIGGDDTNGISPMMLCFLVEPSINYVAHQVKGALEEYGVETRPIIAGNLTHHPAVGSRQVLPMCDYVMRNGFMTGCNPDGDTGYLLETLDKVLK